jgi:chromosome segregation ATPase
MKNLLQNLLILFALGLCVLLALQWHREGVLREQLEKSDDTTQTVSRTIESLRSDVSRLEAEIARVEGLRKQLSAAAAERELELSRLTLELQASDQLAAELKSFKAALDKANQNIKAQNEALQELADERNELAGRYNQLAEDYNALVNRWNEQQAARTNAVSAPR